jgi:hypothetical protein
MTLKVTPSPFAVPSARQNEEVLAGTLSSPQAWGEQAMPLLAPSPLAKQGQFGKFARPSSVGVEPTKAQKRPTLRAPAEVVTTGFEGREKQSERVPNLAPFEGRARWKGRRAWASR